MKDAGKEGGCGSLDLGNPTTVHDLCHWIPLCLELDAGANSNHRTGAAGTDITDYIAGGSWRQDTGEEIELGM